MQRFARIALCLGLAGLVSSTAHAGSFTLGSVTTAGFSATVLPDSSEVGKATNIYLFAVYNGVVFTRGSAASNWRVYTGGAYQVASTLTAAAASNTISVVDFDISSLVGLDVYLGYGSSDADVLKPGHLFKIYTVPSGACDTTTVPAGITVTQNGNNISVSTGGKCVALPVGTQQACAVPAQLSATGINVLSSTTVTSFSLTGISVNLPGIPNPFDTIARSLGASKTCTKNAPADYGKYQIALDVCYDITAQLSASLGAASSIITVTPPITEKLKGTVANTTVADCFTTGADVVLDVFTKEGFVKQADGSYKKVAP